MFELEQVRYKRDLSVEKTGVFISHVSVPSRQLSSRALPMPLAA